MFGLCNQLLSRIGLVAQDMENIYYNTYYQKLNLTLELFGSIMIFQNQNGMNLKAQNQKESLYREIKNQYSESQIG